MVINSWVIALSAPQQPFDFAQGMQSGSSITINYTYDPLYCLKEANYSTGDYYHYTYDAVGNRLTQETLLGAVPLTTTYLYDNANRLTNVDSVSYTWDNNGNLLNDGNNTYAYDSANRLIAMSGPFGSSSYGYNGFGDRLTQNGVNYTLDLNTGLTQVLNDGTNTYLYGVGRIAQVNTTTEYFLGDALGSVRQMTDVSGEITLANAYEPYGTVAQTAGSAQTSYGFTGEFTDPSGMVYLRARYYMPNEGRFLTRDTWMGDANNPMSFNLWNYVQANPVNYADPSGHERASCEHEDPAKNITYIENNVKLSKSDWLNTYTAAGIAVQCHRDKLFYDLTKPFDPRGYDKDYAGWGPAQITNKWASTLYGEWIEDPAYPGDRTQSRGYGLRCYIPIAYLRLPKEVQIELAKSCVFCFQKDQIAGIINFGQYFAQEPIYDQRDINVATVYMKRMIQLIVNACKARGCGDTDIYIAAALAQNGPGFTVYSMSKKELRELPSTSIQRTKDVKMDWVSWFQDGDPINTSTQLWRFNQAIKGLTAKNWAIPYIDTFTVDKLINR